MQIYSPQISAIQKLPLVGGVVSAGFPSPAEDFIDCRLDLNELLIRHPAATFFVRATGDSMIKAGIHPGDILIVDKALEVQTEQIVIAVIEGELTVKQFFKTRTEMTLVPANPNYPSIKLTKDSDYVIWGVVTGIVRLVG
jgi:DNA polymerase V